MTNKAWHVVSSATRTAVDRGRAIALAALALLFIHAAGHATSFFVGIGEEAFGVNDITTASDIVSAWPGIDITTGYNCTACISADLTTDVGLMKPGDTLVFYYSGHGLPVTDPGDLTDPDVNVTAATDLCGCDVNAPHADEQIGLENDLTAGTGITDDTLTNILSRIPAGATALVALDACFSGLANEGGDLGGLPIDFISTADAAHCAPQNSQFAPRFQSAFELGAGNFLNSDFNENGVLTEGELFDYLSDDCSFSYMNAAGQAPGPQCRRGNTDANDVVTAYVPEPSGMSVLLAAAGVIGAVKRRCRRA
jgi:hypothetical protein